MWPFGPKPVQEPQPLMAAPAQQTRLLDDPSSAPLQVEKPSRPTLKELEAVQWKGYSGERLGIPVFLRVPLMMAASSVCGIGLGAAKGGPVAGDRYRAENAHRFPTTRSGWYLYHKSKNYHVFIGTLKEGAKFGAILMGWATLFGVTEELIDRSRARLFAKRDEDEDRISGQRDAISTVMAALTVAGAYSWKSGFDKFAAARMSKMALKYSLFYGLAQDTLASLRGDPPAYIDWTMRHTFGTSNKGETR